MRIFAAPSRYIQGPGAIAEVGGAALAIGRHPMVIVDAGVVTLVGKTLSAGFADTAVDLVEFSGEVSDSNIASLLALAGSRPIDVVVAVGGGKALDAGKAVALRLGALVVSVPTIASTDGPASRGIAIYNDDHQLIRVEQMPTNPACVVVDTALIASAPARFLRAGIGDALAKKFEAEGCWAGGGLTKHGTRPLHSARLIADVAFRLLRSHAAGALRAVERKQVDEDLEATVEATMLLSALAFENGGLSIAHSVTRGLMAVRGARNSLHGEHVAYGVLVHLLVDRRPQSEVEDLIAFNRELGLPTRLADLGLPDPTEAEMNLIAERTMNSPHIHNLARHVSAEELCDAIKWLENRPEKPGLRNTSPASPPSP